MANTITLKKSSVAGKVPLPANLSAGELAVNTADQVLYSLASDGTVFQVGNIRSDSTTFSTTTSTMSQVKQLAWDSYSWAPSASVSATYVAFRYMDMKINSSAGAIGGDSHGVGDFVYMQFSGGNSVAQGFFSERRIGITGSTPVSLVVGTKWVLDASANVSGSLATLTLESIDDNTTYAPWVTQITREFLDPRIVTYHAGGVVVTNVIDSTGKTFVNVDSGKNRFLNSASNATYTVPSTVSPGFKTRLYQGTLGGKITVAAGSGMTLLGTSTTTNSSYDALEVEVYNGGYVVVTGQYNGATAAGRVLATQLAGLSTATSSVITASDSVLTAFGKVQAQITAGAVPSAPKWATARTLSFTGDATGSMSVDGSANASAALTLAASGVSAGTYPKVTVDAKGRVTAGASLAATDIPSLDASKITTGTLTVGTSGNAATASKWATARTLTVSGMVSGSVSIDGSAAISLTLSDVVPGLNGFTYVNSWADSYACRYYKKGNMVYMTGRCSHAYPVVTNQQITTLPAGYRPTYDKLFVVSCDSSAGLYLGACCIVISASTGVVNFGWGIPGDMSGGSGNYVVDFGSICFDVND